MKTVIVYGTRHGCTERCALRLKDRMPGTTAVIHVEKGRKYDLSPFGRVIIGSPVYAGRLLKEVGSFCSLHAGELEEKRIGLFLCCLTPLSEAERYVTGLFSESLRSRSCASGIFGGVIAFGEMTPIERFLIRRIKRVPGDISTLSEDTIDLFVRTMNELCPEP